MTERVRLLGVAAALPPHNRTSEEVEARVMERSPGFRLRRGTVEAMTGIRSRRVADDHLQCSDLAAQAGCQALMHAGVHPRDVDVMIFAAAGQDLMEPATAHIVQEKLGTDCQVFDVKNACNSFLNGVQLAESLILSGAARTALVTTGEVCSRAIAWAVRDYDSFKRYFPGYTMGDAGGAAVLGRSDNGRGIFFRRFVSRSRYWPLATILCGGSMHPRGEEYTYLHADGACLKQAFVDEGPPLLHDMMREAGVGFDDFSRFFVHQASVPYLTAMIDATGIPAERVECTVAELGNVASASIPVAMAMAQERAAVRVGDRVMWIGLASGISVGILMIDI